MAFGGRKLRVAKAGLLLNQSAGDPYVPGYERTEGQSKVIQHAMMKGLQFSGSIAGELVPMFDLPGRKLHQILVDDVACGQEDQTSVPVLQRDRKSTRLNSSHQIISYAVFCLKKKKYST